VLADQSIVKVHLGDGDGKIDADGEGGSASEEADQHEDAAEEFGEGREVGAPGRKSEAGDELNMVLKSAEDFVISVTNHDGAQSKTHHEQRQGLKAIEVAQVFSSGGRRLRLQQQSCGGKRTKTLVLGLAMGLVETIVTIAKAAASYTIARPETFACVAKFW
jgi:hypothetical protein